MLVAVEACSDHPLARAICDHARARLMGQPPLLSPAHTPQPAATAGTGGVPSGPATAPAMTTVAEATASEAPLLAAGATVMVHAAAGAQAVTEFEVVGGRGLKCLYAEHPGDIAVPVAIGNVAWMGEHGVGLPEAVTELVRRIWCVLSP